MLYLALTVFGLVLGLVLSRMLIITGLLYFGLKDFMAASGGGKRNTHPSPHFH